ncbi:class IIb bacteriocin, lactobin A/cerein 7B family [uncultured Leuconostoc sp.]|uniref:class IIb bacteriocin, lactobin A/cerein 7B family n=1 Tax=uncultured Leuconostoc sp. TaxID=173262 RepID=UPI0025E4F04F|nr:class IIb bacteriocin, lactobin A/cerein 7B family [uncultured Leuconostoc sp.]
MNSLNNFHQIESAELSSISGGFVPLIITGAMVIKGIGAASAGFGIGYSIGKSL